MPFLLKAWSTGSYSYLSKVVRMGEDTQKGLKADKLAARSNFSTKSTKPSLAC
ncbi:MAG TPA: hypothetical protein PKV73_13585 [Agriterribacter sp.]|nr:hypothetical protein [Agriterribacter sp.]